MRHPKDLDPSELKIVDLDFVEEIPDQEAEKRLGGKACPAGWPSLPPLPPAAADRARLRARSCGSGQLPDVVTGIPEGEGLEAAMNGVAEAVLGGGIGKQLCGTSIQHGFSWHGNDP